MKAVLLIAALLVATPVYAQELAPVVVLSVGSALDLATTVHALATVPGAVEGNPILSHGGTSALVGTKVALTAAVVVAITRLSKRGHPKAAQVLGYVGGFTFAAIAYRNSVVGR